MTNWSNWQKLAKKLKIQNRQNGLIDQNKKKGRKTQNGRNGQFNKDAKKVSLI